MATTEPDDRASSIACVRVLIDPGSAAYARREIARIGAAPLAPAKLRAAAALLRHLRPAWRSIGVRACGDIPATAAHDLFERWRIVPAEDPSGEVVALTLIVRSETPALLDGTAWDDASARSELEALGNADVRLLAIELAPPMRIRAADAPREPALRNAAAIPHACCASCGAPLVGVAEGAHCFECAAPVAA